MGLGQRAADAVETITVEAVRRCMAAHVPLYSWRKPTYQYVALATLQQHWDPRHRSALDVGGGTGVIAHTLKTLFGLERVATVDVQDRFLPSLGIETATYDGANLPFADGSFDCVLLFNVLHHVPLAARAGLIGECRRVAGRGPIYIKDHLSFGSIDDARLAALDFLGNVPFSGMVRASYLREEDWRDLAARTGHHPGERLSGGGYRTGVMGALFPNRLEISMCWQPV
jgi:ubiquinone/menaquinone biosynthesis C-methylase UbiE